MKTVIRTMDELTEWGRSHSGVIALDTETTSLNYLDLQLLGISMSDGTDTCYVLWPQEEPNVATYTAYVSIFLTECVTRLVFHNAVYDLKVLYKHGIQHTENIYCSMTGAHIINENGPKKLKVLAVTELGIDPASVKTFLEASAYGTGTEEFYEYAMLDALYTYQLYDKQRFILKRQDLEYLAYDIEFPFQFAIRDMEINGITVSKDKVQALLDEVEPRIHELYRSLYDLSGTGYSMQYNMFGPAELISNINLNNNQRCAEIIENRLGLEIHEQTPGGQPSVDKFTLKRLAGEHPFIDALTEYNTYSTVYNSFLKNAIGRICADGRTRPSVNNCIARTGRLSYSNPNLQNMPRPGTCPVEFRDCIVAAPGYKLVGADYSGQELRIMAHVSQDPGMVEAFLKNQDLHLAMANRFYHLGIPDECLVTSHPEYEGYKDKYKKKRNDAKIINFGIAFGKSPIGFASDFKVSVEEATKIVNAYFAAAPGVKKAIDDCHKKLYRQKYVATLCGRRRRFDVINNRAKRQSFNHKIQGSAADMIKIAMSRMVPEFKTRPEWDARLVLSIHDEVVVEVRAEYVDETAELVVQIMKNAMKLCVPLEVDVNIGNNYGQIK